MNFANPEIGREDNDRSDDDMVFTNKINPREYSKYDDYNDNSQKDNRYNPHHNFQFKDTQADTFVNKVNSKFKFLVWIKNQKDWLRLE